MSRYKAASVLSAWTRVYRPFAHRLQERHRQSSEELEAIAAGTVRVEWRHTASIVDHRRRNPLYAVPETQKRCRR